MLRLTKQSGGGAVAKKDSYALFGRIRLIKPTKREKAGDAERRRRTKQHEYQQTSDERASSHGAV